MEAGQLAAVDPDCRSIALHLYDGQLKARSSQPQQRLHIQPWMEQSPASCNTLSWNSCRSCNLYFPFLFQPVYVHLLHTVLECNPAKHAGSLPSRGGHVIWLSLTVKLL